MKSGLYNFHFCAKDKKVISVASLAVVSQILSEAEYFIPVSCHDLMSRYVSRTAVCAALGMGYIPEKEEADDTNRCSLRLYFVQCCLQSI